MKFESLPSSENRELTAEESVAFNDVLQTFIGRIAAEEHSFDRDPQEAIDRWVAENATKYEKAFNDLKEEEPNFIKMCNTDTDAVIKLIENKLRD